MRGSLAGPMTIALLLAVSAAGAQSSVSKKPVQPSFDCHHTTTAVERVICSHDDLATLDLDMMRLYRDAVTKAPASARQRLQTEQGRWLARRNDCTETATRTLQQCIEAEYRTRIQQLTPPKNDGEAR